MLPTGPRTIDVFRRVTIPAAVADQSGVKQNSWVRIGVAAEGIVEIVPVRAPRSGRFTHRDPARPRRLRTSRQIALPAPVMESAGLAVGTAVAFMAARGGVQLFDAARVIAASPAPLNEATR